MTGSSDGAIVVETPHLGDRTHGWLRRIVAGGVRIVVGTALCLTPFTAIVALGWMQRLMRREAAVTLLRRTARVDRREAIRRLARNPATAELACYPGFFGDKTAAGGVLRRYFGGLWRNISEGITAVGAVVATTLLFALLLLGAWWAGWENSFNKGYEQSAVGPLTWLAGATLAIATLRYLPIATAHVASERRLAAVAEVRRIRELTGAAGMSLIWPALMIALGSLAVLGLRILPVLLQRPETGFADLDEQGIERVRTYIAMLSACVVFLTALIYRLAAAKAYGRALHRLGGPLVGSPTAPGSVVALAGEAASSSRRPLRITQAAAALVVLALSTMAVAALLVGQFMNHSWLLWMSFPVFGVPWLP